MSDKEESFWWTQLEKIENLRGRVELAFLIPDLSDKNREILENSLKRIDEREATARFQLGLPYEPLSRDIHRP